MKIAILRNPMGIGGAELSLLDMAINLKKMNHDVWMHYDAGDSASMREFNKHGRLSKRYGKESSFIFDNKNIINEKWAIKQLKDTDLAIIIHRHLFSKNLAQAVNMVPKKIVYAPGKNIHHIYGKYEGIDSYGPLIKNIDYIIFNSKYTLNRHNKIDYPARYKRKFKHVHPPIHMSYYQKRFKSMDRTLVRKRLGFDSSVLHIGVIGRLIPSKEPMSAINIAKNLIRLGVKFKMHFIGDGALGAKVRAKIKSEKLGKYIKVWGMQDDPLEHMLALDVVLHLCKHESLSRALREAMLMRRPIVAFHGAGNLELLRDRRLRGILFKENGEAPGIIKNLSSRRPFLKKLGILSYQSIIEMEKDAISNIKEIIR